jgi:uncharacterized protein (TIGR02118 family)
MSFKAIILLTRRADMTHEEFVQWWLNEHAPLARQLPGVRAITFNVVEQEGEPPCDGITELWFDSRADFDAAYADPIGQGVAADSIAHVTSRVRMMVTEHRIQS